MWSLHEADVRPSPASSSHRLDLLSSWNSERVGVARRGPRPHCSSPRPRPGVCGQGVWGSGARGSREAGFCPQGWPRALVLLSLGRLPKGVPHSLRLTAGWGGQGEERGRLLPAPHPRHDLEVFPTRCLPFCPWACGAIAHTLMRHRRPSRGTGRGPSGGSRPLACVTGRLGRVSSSRRGRTRPSGPCCAPEEAPRVRSLGPGGRGERGAGRAPPF